MKQQINVRIDNCTAEEIADLDKQFTEAGWVIRGINDTIEFHDFRIYQWEPIGVVPIYPSGYEPHTEPIDLNQLCYTVEEDQ